MSAAIGDSIAGPAIADLPVHAIRAARHPQGASRSFVLRQTSRPAVFPIDAEKAHLVATGGVRLAFVAMHTEQFLEVRDVLRPGPDRFFGEENVRSFAIDEGQVQTRLLPANPVRAGRIAHAVPGPVAAQVPHLELP